jgi:GNAT superfamily N-acetyltransferase
MNSIISKPQKENEEEIKALFSTVIIQNFKDYGFYDTYRKDIPYEIRKQITALEEYFASNGKKTFFLVAKDGNKIIGTIAYGKANADIERYYAKNLTNIPEIKSAYILPEYQRRGIGTKLFEEIMQVLRNNGIKEFCLANGYPKAQKFWTKRLGEPVVIIRNRRGAGNDYHIWRYEMVN